MRCCRTLLAAAVALAAAHAGLADAARATGKIHIPLDSAPVTLSATHLRQPLSAGESVVLSWTALPELARHPWVDEWEAFLSFDGGETYPVRLTPHLDLGRRSFAIELPAVATRQARWMLRFGDEAREVEFEFPELFEIHPSRGVQRQPLLLARGRGEPARLGDLGVGAWVEGSRTGHGSRTMTSARSEAGLAAVEPPGFLGFRAATAAPPAPQTAEARISTHPLAGTFASTSTAPAASPRGASIEPRRSTCRQNE
jgi:hypothetical protein